MKQRLSEFTILIVDDIPTNVLLVNTILTREGYKTIVCETGADAVRLAHEIHPNLILLDIMMPDMDGFEVIQQLKCNPKTNHIPVIIVSALADSSNMRKSYELGAVEFITKPIHREEMLKRIEHRYEMFYIERFKEELENVIETRDTLAAVIGSDLRSPLGMMKSINNSLLDLIDKEKVGEDAYRMMLLMNKTAKESYLLLDNLQQWIKIRQCKDHNQLLNREFFNIHSEIKRIIKRYTPIADLQRVSLVAENLDQPLYGNIDNEKFCSIIKNMLMIGLKNCSEGNTIIIRTEQKENTLTVSLYDENRILSQDEHDVFNDQKTSIINDKGTGIGLLVCKDYAEMHNGNLRYESEVGKGFTLYVSLKTD